jgi:voltage-gated potassium channel
VRLTNKLWAGALGLTVLTALGTLGYVWIERVSVLDALYMVAITITTVGFSEVFEMSPASRVLTIAIMILGVGLALYTASAAIERLLDLGVERQRARTRKLISELSDHVIVCGFGRVGRGVFRDLVERGEQVIVIEEDPALSAEAETEGVPVLMGDATFNDTLEAAGIARAKALVACVADDSDNLVIILSARSIHPTIHLVSRANEQESESKLRLAGANRVVAPQVVGSERLAAMTVERNLAEVFDIVVGGRAVEFSVEELLVEQSSSVVGCSIREAAIRERSGALILAVEDQSRNMLHAPSPDHVLLPNSAVIVVGTADQVAAAAELFAG